MSGARAGQEGRRYGQDQTIRDHICAISRESAKYFLIRVQKSFKTEKPPHRLILEFIDGQNFESLPKPHQVAALMNKGGVWVHPLNPEPPTLVDEEDIYGE